MAVLEAEIKPFSPKEHFIHLSPGKLTGLRNVSDSSGRLKVLALDQSNSFKKFLRALYEKQGHLAIIVEHWSPFPKPFGKRHDMLGVFDLFVLKASGEAWGIQATTNAHVANRIEKMQASEAFRKWKELGGRAAVVGWAKMGPRGGRKTWTHKEIIL